MKQSIINSLLILLLSQMHAFASAQDSNTIKPSSVEAEEGTAEAELNFYMSNEISMCGYEFYLQLPEGVSVKEVYDEEEEENIIYAFNGGRARASHVLSCTKRPDGTYYLFCYEPENKNFYDSDTKKDLPLCTVTLSLASTLKSGTYDIIVKDTLMNHNNTETGNIDEYPVTSEKSVLTIKAGNFDAVDAGGNSISKSVKTGDDVTILDTYKSLAVTENVSGVNVSYSRTFGSTNAQALYLPYSLDIFSELADYDVYEIGNAETGKVHVKKLTSGSTSANTPYIIQPKATGPATITATGTTLQVTSETPIDFGDYYVVGTYSLIEYGDVAGDWYALKDGMFMKAGTGAYLSPFRFYLKPKNADAKESLEIIVDDETTGINGNYSKFSGGNNQVFNLAGQNVGSDYKGIVIINNQKILQK